MGPYQNNSLPGPGALPLIFVLTSRPSRDPATIKVSYPSCSSAGSSMNNPKKSEEPIVNCISSGDALVSGRLTHEDAACGLLVRPVRTPSRPISVSYPKNLTVSLDISRPKGT